MDDRYNKIRARVEEIRNSPFRTASEAIWMRNIAYCAGIDNVQYNATTRQFIGTGAGSMAKVRLSVNKVLATLQNRLAKLSKNPPRFEVQPESMKNDDKEAARLGLNVLQYIWDKQKINEKRIPLYMWLQECGHSLVKVNWDPMLGRKVQNPETGEIMWEGDVRIDVVNPFEVFFDPFAKTFDDVLSTEIFHARARKLSYFRDQYPERGGEVKEEDCWLMSARNLDRINSQTILSGGSQTDQAMKGCAIEIIHYEAPSTKKPNGWMTVCAGGIVLEEKELPVGEIPFAFFADIIVAGKIYPEAVATSLLPLQDYLNHNLRMRSEWLKRTMTAKYLVARGSGIQSEAMNDQSGEVVSYDPVPNAPNGGAPSQLMVPNIPAYAYNEDQNINGYFNDQSGISEISRGSLPSATIPGVGMQLLVENDNSRIGVITEQHEHSWARVGQLVLKYVQEFYKIPRKLKLTTKSGQYNITTFVGDDLNNNTDVTVVRGSSLPTMRTIKRQEIMNLFQNGLLGSPQDPKTMDKVLGLMEFGDIQGAWDDYAINMAQINRGIKQMEAGEPCEIHELDSHDLWVSELNNYRKGEKYVMSDPYIQSLFEACLQGHLDALVKLSTPSDPEEFMPPDLQGMPPPGPEGEMPQPPMPPPMEG